MAIPAGDDLVKVLDVFQLQLRERSKAIGKLQTVPAQKVEVGLLFLAELIGAACDCIELVEEIEERANAPGGEPRDL